MRILTCSQMKESEKNAVENGTSYLELMKNAGTQMAKLILEREETQNNCVVLCGNGNNAGDGFVIADYLSKNECEVSVILLCGTPTTSIAKKVYARAVTNPSITVIDAESGINDAKKAILMADVIIDAIFGTGFHGAVDDRTADIINAANASRARTYSVDIASGFNADNGKCEGTAINADVTVTFAAPKPAHFKLPCADNSGEIVICDIGIAEYCFDDKGGTIFTVDEAMAYAPLKPRPFDCNKGTFGKLLNISGSFEYKGAAYFSSSAAYKCGAGLVTLAAPRDITGVIATLSPETIYLPLEDIYNPMPVLEKLKNSSACLIGCGLGINDNTKQLLFTVVKNAECPLIIDADGINILSSNIDILKDKKAQIILTPHPGEMSRLTGLTINEIQNNPFSVACEFSKQNDVVVVLKGQNTVTALPDGRVYMNTSGNAGLAKAGSGDVLAGIIASFAAQGLSVSDAAVSGVYIHGKCADMTARRISQYGMTAHDLLSDLPYIFSCKNNF